ncbi:hypothetical protein RchiOBHm_Chr2g0139831 [Rosa chinensis]|uniref:Uncharacterized protein n=1 Tax=Rosa chinensis TaxID=74649 RepID=A0A2P6RX78_ROSCH|nr:hypothetical protein RchiOBHm_Chr2g0139831 [Rosa chinensis]
MRYLVLCIVLNTIMRLSHLDRVLQPLIILRPHPLDETDLLWAQDFGRSWEYLQALLYLH